MMQRSELGPVCDILGWACAHCGITVLQQNQRGKICHTALERLLVTPSTVISDNLVYIRG